MKEVYQIQYRQIDGEEAWIDIDPVVSTQGLAIDRLAYEQQKDPTYNHRIVRRRIYTTVMTSKAKEKISETTD